MSTLGKIRRWSPSISWIPVLRTEQYPSLWTGALSWRAQGLLSDGLGTGQTLQLLRPGPGRAGPCELRSRRQQQGRGLAGPQRGCKASTAALKSGRTTQQRHCSTNRNADCTNTTYGWENPPPRVLLSLQFLQLTLMELHSSSATLTVIPTKSHFYLSVLLSMEGLCKVTAFTRIRQRSTNSSVGILSLFFHSNPARPTSATVGIKLHSGLVATQKTLETAVSVRPETANTRSISLK